MSSSGGLLDFFILEATEYLDQVDALVRAASSVAPDTERLATLTRALRGSSTMARLGSHAELAGAMELVSRALREGRLPWQEPVRLALVAALDDFRLLVHSLRAPSGAWEAERRAGSRVRELRGLTPAPGAPAPPVVGTPDPSFFAIEVEAIAGSLDAAVGNPRDPRPLDLALARVRALRGIAALRDLPPLPDVGEAIERAARQRATAPGTALPEGSLRLLAAAAAVLARAATQLRAVGRPSTDSPEITRFLAAVAAAEQPSVPDEAVVPVASLFFADLGPHVVTRASAPPTTPERRFRRDLVPHAEHLRRLVADARAAADPVARERVTREMRTTLAAIRDLAESYAMPVVAAFFGDAPDRELFEPVMLASFDEAAERMTAPDSVPLDQVATALEALRQGRVVDRAIGEGFGPVPERRLTPPRAVTPAGASLPATPAPRTPVAVTPPRHATPVPAASVAPSALSAADGAAPRRETPVRAAATTPPHVTPSGPRHRTVTPTGAALHAFLESGLAGLHELEEAPLAAPAPMDDASLVSIDDLVYRGRTALERARELRDELRRRGSADEASLDELFDLLDLASRD